MRFESRTRLCASGKALSGHVIQSLLADVTGSVADRAFGSSICTDGRASPREQLPRGEFAYEEGGLHLVNCRCCPDQTNQASCSCSRSPLLAQRATAQPCDTRLACLKRVQKAFHLQSEASSPWIRNMSIRNKSNISPSGDKHCVPAPTRPGTVPKCAFCRERRRPVCQHNLFRSRVRCADL